MNTNTLVNTPFSLSKAKTVLLAVLLQLCLKFDAENDVCVMFGTKDGYSNTPSTIPQPLFRISLGWLSITFNAKSLDYRTDYFNLIRDACCSHFQDEIVGNCVPVNGYKNAVEFGTGATLNWSYNRPDFQLLLRQNVIESMDLAYLLCFLKDMLAAGGKVTRIDLTIDDFTRSFDLEEMAAYTEAGHLVARTSEYKPYFFKNIKTGEFTEKRLTFFKRSSAFFLRAYDKFLESKGKINSIRVEAEVKKRLAQAVAKTLTDFAIIPGKNPDDPGYLDNGFFNQFILGVIAEKIDFRDKNSNARVNRRTRLAFWDDFLQKAEKVALYIAQPVKTLDKTIKWLNSQVAASLALVVEFRKSDPLSFLDELVSLGNRKRRQRHTLLLNRSLKQ